MSELHPPLNGPRRRGSFGRNDLRVRPFPELAGFDGRRVGESVELLRTWAEGVAEDAVEWYLAETRRKRIIARSLRASTLVLLVGGALAPLINATATGELGALGYVLLAAAAGCAAFDHFFGLSTGWVRAMGTAQGLQRRLNAFRLAWATRTMRDNDLSSYDAAAVGERTAYRIDLIRQLVADVEDLVDGESREWLARLRSDLAELPGEAHRPTTPAPRLLEIGPGR
jgi:hypothetical protein